MMYTINYVKSLLRSKGFHPLQGISQWSLFGIGARLDWVKPKDKGRYQVRIFSYSKVRIDFDSNDPKRGFVYFVLHAKDFFKWIGSELGFYSKNYVITNIGGLVKFLYSL